MILCASLENHEMAVAADTAGMKWTKNKLQLEPHHIPEVLWKNCCSVWLLATCQVKQKSNHLLIFALHNRVFVFLKGPVTAFPKQPIYLYPTVVAWVTNPSKQEIYTQQKKRKPN